MYYHLLLCDKSHDDRQTQVGRVSSYNINIQTNKIETPPRYFIQLNA